ncbi:MAG: site-2 protease family protein [Patescibacteria group bacterium]|mgnify:CR=1 FL=1
MLTTIIFIIVLAILIFVHELGHFITARFAGIRVDAFKLGFGPKIISWKKGETEYGVNLIPFGGYVKIHGENPDEESVSGPDLARSFVNKPRWKQVIVLVAGVFFNFLFAWLLYISAFLSGVTATTDGFEKYSQDFSNSRVMITYLSTDSPAENAGLVVGDIIENSNDVETIQQMINDSHGSSIKLSIKHQQESRSVEIVPIQGIVNDKYAIGIAMQKVADLRLSLFSAIWEGLHYTLIMIRETVVGLYTFVVNIFQGTANFSDVAGPIGIAGIVGSAAYLGFTYLLMITALISINLGVINLIPFPALDGGRTLFVLIEGVIRRRISMRFTNIVNTIGFILLMLLMVVVTYKDIVKSVK